MIKVHRDIEIEKEKWMDVCVYVRLFERRAEDKREREKRINRKNEKLMCRDNDLNILYIRWRNAFIQNKFGLITHYSWLPFSHFCVHYAFPNFNKFDWNKNKNNKFKLRETLELWRINSSKCAPTLLLYERFTSKICLWDDMDQSN